MFKGLATMSLPSPPPPPPPPPRLFTLRRRRNVTMVNNVCEATPRSLFWALKGLNEFPEVCFEFPFILIGKSTMAFLTGQSLQLLKSWYTCGPGTGISVLFRRRTVTHHTLLRIVIGFCTCFQLLFLH